MKTYTTRRSFIRVLGGLFAFIPAASSLTASPLAQAANLSPADAKKQIEEEVKARTADGLVLGLEGDSIWIKDRHVDRLRLIVTDQSLVWKGVYNKGKAFNSYLHAIEPGDDVVVLGQRAGTDFTVEKLWANVVNTYVKVDSIGVETDGATITYTDAFVKAGPVARSGTVRVLPSHLIDPAMYKSFMSKSQELRGKSIQVIGLRLKDGTLIAANILQ